MKRVTMKDVADRAGVSKTAVSFALNDPSRLSDTTLKQILDAARELGFTQNPAARMLRTQRTNSIGLLLPQALDKVLENPYYTQFLQGVGQVCHREGLTLLMAPPLRGSVLKTIPYAAVDGFIVSGLEVDRGEVDALRQRQIPFVLVDSDEHPNVASIEIDDGEGMRALVEHLLQNGHRRISFLAFESGLDTGRASWRGPLGRRMRGAAVALEAVGLSLDSEGIAVREIAHTRAAGTDAFKALWAEPVKPTAIVCFSDMMAYGVLDAARAIGVSIPDEVSVAGFDDLLDSALVTPSLTTVRQPIETKGRLAAEHLVDAIAAGKTDGSRRDMLKTTLLVRASTAMLKG